jgi:cytochrome c oxidase subunit III
MSAAGERSGPSIGKLGLILLLLALGVLFGSTIVGYLVIRSRATVWPPPGMPGLPKGMWISTVLILASTATMEFARTAIRQGTVGGQGPAIRQRTVGGLSNGLAVTFLLGVAFLVNQMICWIGPVAAQIAAKPNVYTFGFFVLTGLHAAHVLGGLIPLGITWSRSRAGRYTVESHEGVDFVGIYWHFLTAVWVVLFAVLVLTA